MRGIFLLMIGIALTCCKPDGKNQFLQEKNVQLASPRINASNKIIDSSATLKAELAMDGVALFYTFDGREPKAEDAALYTGPISVLAPGTYKFKAFHPEWKPSEIVAINFVKKGLSVDSVIWNGLLNQQYTGRGSRTLVNHRKASNNYMDKEWLGFDAATGMTCIFDAQTNISSIDIGYLNHPGAWIFPPGSIQIYTSEDGLVFRPMNKYELPQPSGISDAAQQNFSIPLNKNVKGVKLEFENLKQIPDWHEGAGQNGWMFMDEIIFNK